MPKYNIPEFQAATWSLKYLVPANVWVLAGLTSIFLFNNFI